MTVHLLNAAVMPHEGCYQLRAIAPVEFKMSIRAAHGDGVLRHYIGYPNTLKVVENLTGLDLGGTNVDQTKMEDNAIFYVIRLRRRVSPTEKRIATRGVGDRLEISDFDFFKGRFVNDPANFVKS